MVEERLHKSVTLICSRNTPEGVYPPLILAVQAVRLGAATSIFFTFDGVEVVRRGGIARIKHIVPGIGGIVPGASAIATHMILKLAEERANVPDPAALLEMILLEGVKCFACKMTMDMMEIGEEDLVEGVRVMDAEQYMKLALNSGVNMFT